MKKLLYSLMTLAAALTVTSCLKEVAPTGNSTSNEPVVNATFTVNIDSKSTKAFATASQISKLHIAFYKDGVLDASLSKTGTAAIVITPGESLTKVLENLKLSRGAEYEIICWAESAASPYTLDFTNKTVTYANLASLQANQDTYDAFYGAKTLTSTDTQSDVDATIQLKRPFAQVNVLVPNDNTSAYTSFTSTMTVTVPTMMNLSTGELTGEASAVTFGATDSPISESLKDAHKYLAMNYVFAPTTAVSYPVSFTVTPNVAGDAKTVDLAAVSLQRNRRTNLVGNIFQTEVNGTITVTIVPGADPDSEEPIQSPDVTVSIGAGSAAPAGNTVNLPLSGSTPQTITIESNSTGEVTFDPAANPGVATVTPTGSGTATVTPVADGSTTFVAHIAQGVTKADPLRAVDITFNVTVTGKGGGASSQKAASNLAFSEPSATVTINADNNIFPTLEGEKTDDVTYSLENVSPEGCVTIDGSNGAVNLVAAGTATVKATAPETDEYAAGEATYTLAVNAAPVQTYDFTTVAGLKALLGAESASFTGTLTDAVVSFVAGTRDAVIKDATGSILYHKETGHNLLQGQTISGDVIVNAVLYNGINEITDLDATVEGTGSAVEPQVVTLAQLAADYATYESAYVKVVGVTSKTTTTAKGNISVTQDDTDYIVYTNVAIPVNTGDIFTAEGTVTKYNSTEEIKVWKSADLTVTTEAPILSTTPATKTVKADVTSVTWNITSNTDWTITPGTGVTASKTFGNGDANVTLSFGANESTDEATYTATVKAEGCDDVTITITQNGTGTTVPIEIVAEASSICSGSAYDLYSNNDRIITCGSSNGAFGCNSNNADNKMKLGDNYVVATPLDAEISNTSTHYAALISKGKLDAGITSITLAGTLGSGMTVGVTISADGSTWTKLADFGSESSFTFSAQESVYYAVVIKAANKSNARYTNFTATFSNQ